MKLTEKQIQEVKRLRENGESLEAIADQFPVHRTTISRITKDTQKQTKRITRRKVHPDVIAKAQRLAEQGMLAREIIEETGISKTAFYKYIGKQQSNRNNQKQQPQPKQIVPMKTEIDLSCKVCDNTIEVNLPSNSGDVPEWMNGKVICERCNTFYHISMLIDNVEGYLENRGLGTNEFVTNLP